MSYQELALPSKDGYELSLKIYEAADPKAVVTCIHGMEEYQDRYRPFAEFLQAAGYTAVTADLRGHGKSAPVLSHIADRDGHLRLLEDEEAILEMIHERWAGVPVILFAHSMGTIIARVLLQKHSREYQKAVLSGYPNPNGAAGAGKAAAKADPAAVARVLAAYKPLSDAERADFIRAGDPLQPRHRLADQALAAEDAQELLGALRRRQRPEALAAATGEDHGAELWLRPAHDPVAKL